ncbi:MAG: efflux RND transporter periplasmic adaptor subunit [Alphaproteobacteria bacterium]|nr:efflux RND transporter periplasmic adaptor subunit [Alphaproteobacteria bacterium]
MLRAILALIMVVLSAMPALAQAEFIVAVRDVADRKAVFATVQSVDVVAARARIGGTVRGLSVDEGSAVRSGQIIATVDDPKLGLQMVAIDARIRSLEAQKKLAGVEYDRLSALRKSGTISQARLDESQTNLNVVTGNHAALVAERAVVAESLAEGAVLAPGDGRVLRVPVTEGSVILPGEAVAVIAAERYVLRIELPERHAQFIRVGDEVLVGARGLAVDAGNDLRTGRITQVYPEMSNGRLIADAEVDELGDYFVGERTRVYVATGQRQAIVIPRDFLLRRYGVTYAIVKGEGEVMVQPGQRTDEEVEILSGLAPGDILLKP